MRHFVTVSFDLFYYTILRDILQVVSPENSKIGKRETIIGIFSGGEMLFLPVVFEKSFVNRAAESVRISGMRFETDRRGGTGEAELCSHRRQDSEHQRCINFGMPIIVAHRSVTIGRIIAVYMRTQPQPTGQR